MGVFTAQQKRHKAPANAFNIVCQLITWGLAGPRGGHAGAAGGGGH